MVVFTGIYINKEQVELKPVCLNVRRCAACGLIIGLSKCGGGTRCGENTCWKLGLNGGGKSYMTTNVKSYLDSSSVGMHSIRLYFVSRVTYGYMFRLVTFCIAVCVTFTLLLGAE